jgi:hypothetical protein
MGGNQTGCIDKPIAPTKQQFNLVCKVFEVRNGRREEVKKSVEKFFKGISKCQMKNGNH